MKHFSFLWHASLQAWIGILYLGIISTVVAYVLYFYLLSTVGSVKQTMVGFLLPVFGVFEGAVFEHEWVGVSALYKALEVLGAVLIVAGVYFVNFSGRAKTPEESEDDEGGCGGDGNRPCNDASTLHTLVNGDPDDDTRWLLEGQKGQHQHASINADEVRSRSRGSSQHSASCETTTKRSRGPSFAELLDGDVDCHTRRDMVAGSALV